MEVDTLATLGIDIETDKAKSNLDSLNATMKKTTDAAKQMTDAFGPKVGGDLDVFGPIVPGATAATGATKQLASEMLRGSEVTRGFRDIIHTMDPILMSAGASMGGLGAFAMAARAGVAGLGIAIAGGLTVELARVGDESVLAKDKLSDFFNSTSAGSAAFERLQQTASAFGGTAAALAPSLMSLTRTLQEQQRISGVVYAPLAEGLTKTGERAAALQEILLGFARQTGATWSEATASVNKLADALQKSKQFTSDLFTQIEKESPKLANALAEAFGYRGEDAVIRFNAALQQSPRNIRDLISALDTLKEKSKENSDGFATFSQALDTTWNSLKRMGQAFADATGLSASLKSGLKDIDAELGAATSGWSHLSDVLGAEGATGTMKLLNAEFQLGIEWLKVLFNPSPGNIFSLGAQVYSMLGGIIDKAREAAEWVAKALGLQLGAGPAPGPGAGNAAAGGPTGAESSGNAATGGPFEIPSGGNATAGGQFAENPFAGNAAAGGLPSEPATGDFGATSNEASMVPDTFATGGAFTVGGDGGIDTTKVSFMATRGERVTITPTERSLSASGYGTGHFADGGDFTVDQNSTLTGSTPDQAAMPQGQRLSETLNGMGDTFERLGVTIGDIGKTITGAGNDKMIDVVRLGTMQTVAAVTMAGDKTVNAIAQLNATEQQLISAVGSLASATSASSSGEAAATSSTAAMGPHSGTVYGGTTYGGTSGFRVQGGSVSGMSGGDLSQKLDKLFGNVPQPTAAPITSAPKPTALPYSAPAPSTSMAAPQNAFPAGNTGTLGTDPYSPGGIYDMAGAGFAPGTGTETYDYGGDIGGGYAEGGEFDVPAGFDNDSYPLRVESGEHVKVTPKHLNTPASHVGGIGNVTVIIQTPDQQSFVRTEAQTGQQVRRMIDRSLLRR